MTKKRATPPPAVPSIVALGASAGGLEALERFLAAVPADTAMAIVVIQHLDPAHKGLLTEILQRATSLAVVEVTDSLRLEPRRVHVIPPNVEMVVEHGALRLRAPKAQRWKRLPIDVFFRSLAADQGPRSVGVILSGMGVDGTAGARAIRHRGGGVFAQAPGDAKFPSMPRSVVDAGFALAAVVVEELPAKISAWIASNDHARVQAPEPPTGPTPEDTLEPIIAILHRTSGHDFALYKRSSLRRRVERRMAVHQLATIDDYVRHLDDHPHEAELLFKEILIGVTSFFRDPAVWERMAKEILPTLIEQRTKGGKLRAWVPACSTGEEAYSFAIAFKEAIAASGITDVGLQVFATDLDEAAIARARAAVFSSSIEEDVSPERLARFFVPEARGGYRVRKEIRDLVVFAIQNVIDDPPFTKLDFLSCRNLLIYFAPALQQRLVPLFHYSLRPGGVLLLGSAETIGTFSQLFTSVAGEQRFYRRVDPVATTGGARFAAHAARELPPARGEPEKPSRASVMPQSIEQFLLRRFAPASVVASAKGDILFVSGRTGRYLEVPAGRANWNLFAMARDGVRQPLVAAFQELRRAGSAFVVTDARVTTERVEERVRITVETTDEPGLRGALLVLFEPQEPGVSARAKKGASKRGARTTVDASTMERELRDARTELEAVREDMQTSEEELKSTNEELQSTNEELQSANEELTTSKEEMQSINEELRTLNGELQANVDELSRTSNDMKNLLDSTEIAVLFLDNDLNVRRFTPQMTTLINLIPGDVGRPLADLASQLDYDNLAEDIREVLRTLVFIERTVESRDHRRLRIRIMPYRTSDNRIDGIVMTFTSILS